ncbi:hypothetical protein A2400_00220 [candidate division WS6 bacterium RIFOXYB1_FULL_33_14]|uniref:Peptidase M23 domain-containing protein n=1 Tax=candidate division WS6 bacterium RIFOXYB1_FULL_33_14 TaxID=1817896 RepID=A0A1F4UKS3_9BACT|nr:MAG: hypothetical protein A2400_00220 [candidate division WS6 bacterium RIFOXYB1_FULL_33_14]
MKKILVLVTIGVITLISFLSPFKSDINAAEACPESMAIQERYLCLQRELQKLENSQGSLEKRLKDEDYQQLSLKEKLSYLTTQISQNERVIETLHMEITTQDIEINLLSEKIQDKEDDLSLLTQEINILKETVNQRVTESYKYSFVSTFELILDVKNFDEVLRKTKYLIETRIKDRNSLMQFSDKSQLLEEEEILLASEKAELQIKRNNIEEEKVKLLEEKKILDQQRVEKDRLLAESLRRESEYKKQLAETTAAISSIDEKISDVVIKLFNQGLLGSGMKVVAGQTIGYQGHTGCSFGSHLHFDIRNKYDVRQNPANYLVGGTVWYPVKAKVYLAPLDGAMLTQSYKTTHRAWDMVSTTKGTQDGSTYTVPTGICSIVDYYIRVYNRNWAYLTGEGAPVRAIANGKVYYGTIVPDGPNGSKYPAKYALVVHDDGNKSFYLHLR